MKFKKYMKESVDTSRKVLNESDFYNPDAEFSIAEHELDSVYGPIRKLIADGKYDEARAELDALEREVDELDQENSKRRFFRYPKFIINGQRKQIASLRAKLPKTESLDDMERRCENCNTLLNDMETCPKCDDGEEDYADHEDMEESCGGKVVKYGAHWFALKDTDGEYVKDGQGKVKIFSSEEDAFASCDSVLTEVVEELSVREKLKRAYPELNFDKKPDVVEEAVTEELSVREKLKRAYPELNFEEPSELVEGTGADTAHAASEIAAIWGKQEGQEWANTAKKIIDALPDDQMDAAFGAIKNGITEINLNDKSKQELKSASNNEVISNDAIEEADTLDKILNAIDIHHIAKNNPDSLKDFLVNVLHIVDIFEPTPFIEIAVIIINLLPANIVAKILAWGSVLANPVSSVGIPVVKYAKKEIERRVPSEKVVEESLPTDDAEDDDLDDSYHSSLWDEAEHVEYDYDDDYEFDDVEQDRIHTALYGGDATYCRKCGAFLSKNEWGSYCPECDDQ